MAEYAKYGTQTTFYLVIPKAGSTDFAGSADWTPASGDVKISKDGGDVANTTNLPSAVGGTGSKLWSLVLTASELEAAVVMIQIVDSATKAIVDQALRIETYGNASAKIKPDYSDSVRMGLTALPNAAAEASGGLITRGSSTGQLNVSSGKAPATVAAGDAADLANGGFTDLLIDAIKAKTDSLTFTVAGVLDSNVTHWKGSTAPAMSGDAYARLGAPAGASISADIASANAILGSGTYGNSALKALIDAISTLVSQVKAKTDSLTFTVAGVLDSNVTHWKGSTAPAMSGDAYARLGAPAGASVSADLASIKTDCTNGLAVLNSGTYGNSALKALIDAISTLVGQVKAKTDNLPVSPAAVGSEMTLTAAYDRAKTALGLSEYTAPANASIASILASITNVLTAFELDGSVYRLTANALETAPGGGQDYTTILAILQKIDSMTELYESAYRWTEASLINSPVGTGGFATTDREKLYALGLAIEENRARAEFSYSVVNQTNLDKLRRMVGDKDASDILMTDEELLAILAENEQDLNRSAATACEEIASAFARDAVKAIGDMQQDLQQKSENYRKQARLFRQRDDGGEDEEHVAGPGFSKTATSRGSRWRR